MPPRIKFTKEKITDTALDIVRTGGMSALSARSLGKKLGCSPQPIFSYFDNMEDVQRSVIRAAKSLYGEYVRRGMEQQPAFKGVGMQYILFAKEEPELFHLLFMSQTDAGDMMQFVPLVDDYSETVLSKVEQDYALTHAQARRLYNHLAIYTHGIAVFHARKSCALSQEEISLLLTEVFMGVLKEIKGKGK